MTEFGEDLIASLGQALAHAKGDSSGVATTHAMEGANLKAVRKQIGLKQDQMALLFETSLSGYRKWEQGKRAVSGPARSLIMFMALEPEAAVRVLAVKEGRGDIAAPAKRLGNARDGREGTKSRLATPKLVQAKQRA